MSGKLEQDTKIDSAVVAAAASAASAAAVETQPAVLFTVRRLRQAAGAKEFSRCVIKKAR